ncbi:centrosomal protein of 95 kDa isoform X2 [Mus pahari]|uniref:centrosomal protein of 95 kDa isoform X2 n=1 Tax=Mus pahari TaxID=10093 RepID=UPI001114FE47|nr:centrosomal protein of 95 kDa isoform X2 [Mus pahari]
MASSEAEWVTIANNLLFKCHIHLRIHELQDCDANVFIALYQSIVGEKVPDLIVIPRNQEDEAHNVQAVIDSLALDYLQVSLSHITGENIVKGDNESIKNLLEIFDGLLDYLTEYVSESSPNKSETEQYSKDSHGEEAGEDLERTEGSQWRKASFMRCSSDTLGPTWEEDDAESTGEIIRLGDTAHTFSQRSNGAQNSMDLRSRRTLASPGFEPEDMLNPSLSGFLSQNGPPCEAASETPPMSMVPSARKLGEPIRAAIPLHPPYHPSEPRAPCPIGKEYLWSSRHLSTPTSGEYMASSVEPDDAFLTSTLFKDDDQETYLPLTEASRTRKPSKGERDENRAVIPSEHPPFPQKARKPLTEQELHAMSEKLSQRLSELDWMLKTALGDRGTDETDGKDGDAGDEEVRSGNEEMLSQHSDSIMEYGPKKPRPGFSTCRKAPYRSHSLSPSSVNKHRQLEKERKRQHKSKGTDSRHFQAKALTEAFERELRKHKVQENVGLRGIREEEEEETEKSYREAFPKGTLKRSQVQKVYSRKTAAPSPKVKVNEHSLLPLMLEQFPFLYVSDPTLTKMWKQQMAQVEQLKREAQRENRSKKKLQDEIEEALRRHDLLTALVKKEYDHNKRLQDFRDRIQRQRLTQSKIKENRHQSVRARKYYDDYRVQLRAKMMKMRTREEMIFKKLFEEGLQIQKQRLRDLRNYAKEKRNEEKRQHQNELDSMENYYKDQFSLLAEAISQERQELKVRQKFQAQTVHKVKRELRAKMEKEIQQLQHMITQNDDDAFFRELEAERFKARLQLASFQYSKNPFPRGQT